MPKALIPLEDLCVCEQCGHVQADPNWCHKCGRRVALPLWAKKLLKELEAARIALFNIAMEMGAGDGPAHEIVARQVQAGLNGETLNLRVVTEDEDPCDR